VQTPWCLGFRHAIPSFREATLRKLLGGTGGCYRARSVSAALWQFAANAGKTAFGRQKLVVLANTSNEDAPFVGFQ
jgi:hypothetical protein